MPRLPPALEVFPTLRRFAMRPRRLVEVPIGCDRGVGSERLQQSVLHLYHDLGVLVFAGCSPRQVRLIGDILRQVVALGGPGGVVSMLDGWEQKTSRQRERPLRESDLHEAVGEKRAGVIKMEALLQIANSRFEKTLKGKISELRPEVKHLHIRETQVVIPGSPPPRGTIHQTVSGPHRLPVESFTSLAVDRVHGHTMGVARFFTVGTGDYVGAVEIDYLMWQYDEVDKAGKPFWGHGKLPQRRKAAQEDRKDTWEHITGNVMRPLWQLERQVWAYKANEVAESKERIEWGDS